jgi:hypothetical protein
MRRIVVGLVVLVAHLTLALGSLALTCCGTNSPDSSSDAARLRVRNAGSQPIVQLTVLFQFFVVRLTSVTQE